MDWTTRRKAENYDFSGGQIENNARERVNDDILNDRDEIDIDAIVARIVSRGRRICDGTKMSVLHVCTVVNSRAGEPYARREYAKTSF